MQTSFKTKELDTEMDEIPEYLRATIQRMIDIKTQKRIDIEMSHYKKEVAKKLLNEKQAAHAMLG